MSALGTPSISYRQFYEILEEKEREGVLLAQRNPRMPDLLQKIQDSLVGRFQGFDSPLGGLKPIVYADWTASGRALHFIEDFLRTEVMPWYGNTHTTTSITGSQTTHYRHEARQIIAESLNARISGKAADDVVLFCGSGSTSAVTKMVHVLGLNRPLAPGTPDSQRPVVFVGPYSHHSNLLPWRESCAEVVSIADCPMSGVDFTHLEKVLKQYANRPLKIGSFTAASNITGICVDVDAVTALLHKYGALAFWDYATAAPYIKVDMNPVSYPIRLGGKPGVSSSSMAQDDSDDEDDSALQRPNLSKDAIFISGHKFVGGPGTPGVLVVKKKLLDNAVPQSPGGGTVFFVTQEDHRYLSNREEREEGGTPDIVGSIRLGLCFRLKDTVGAEYAKEREALFAKKTLESFCSNKNIVVLGDFKTPRLPIFSFLIRYGGSFLHYNFVAALLNDLFGIQSRGGCQCAGPYGQQLLGLTMEDNRAYEKALLDKLEILRPGFTRFSLTYYHSDAEVDYIISAVHHIADHGYKFLPQYRFNHKTGEWRHTSRFTRFPNRKWLSNFDFERLPIPEKVGLQNWDVETELELFSKVMSDVEGLTEAADSCVGKLSSEECDLMGPEYESLRWFVYPSEVGQDLAKSGRISTPSPGRLRPIQCTIEHESPRFHYRDFIKETLASASASPYSSGRSSPADSPLLNGHGHSHSQPGSRGLLSPGFECRELKLIRQQQQRSPYQPQRIMGSPYAPNAAGLRDLGGGARILTASGQPNHKRPSHNQMDKLTANLKRFATFGRPPVTSPTREKPSSGHSLGRKPDTITYFKNQGSKGEPNKVQQEPAQEGENMMEVDEGAHMAESAPSSSTVSKNLTRRDEMLRFEGSACVQSVQVAETKASHTPPPPPISADSDSSDEDDSPVPKSSPSIVGTTNGFPPPAPACSGPACSLQTRPHQPVDAYKYPLRKGGLENAPAYTHMEQRFASLPHKQLFPKAPPKLRKVVGQAIRDWDMIQEGDRLCLGLSGGKDSLTLLHILLDLQKRAPVRFTLAAATVDPQTPSFDPRSLIPYMKALGVEYHFLSQPIIDQAKKSIRGDSLCAFCSRFKRGILYTCCQQNGYNKLVLAQHLDDLAESLFMSMLHNGQVRTMKANYVGEKGIRVIRPLVYARESTTKAFAQTHVLPIINENCPACFEQPKERQRVKEMLAKEESLYPRMFDSLRSAMMPLMDDQMYDVMKSKLEAMEKQKLQHWEERKSRGQGRKEEAMLRRNDGAKMEEEEEGGGKVFGQSTMVLDEDDDDLLTTNSFTSSVVCDNHLRAAAMQGVAV